MILSTESHPIDGEELRAVLNGISDDRALACGVVLDALHSFRKGKHSSGQLAPIVRAADPPLSQEKMRGVIDALREFRLVHPVHHSVLDAVSQSVEESVVVDSAEPEKWVVDALRLLESDYESGRFRHLLSLVTGPFNISRAYTEPYLKAVEVHARAARTLDPAYPLFAREHRTRIDQKIADIEADTRDSGQHEEGARVVSYLRRVEALLGSDDTPTSSGVVVATPDTTFQGIVDLLDKRSGEIDRDVARRVKWVRTSVAIAFAGILTIPIPFVAPWVIAHWDRIEPLSYLITAAISAAVFVLGLVGFVVNDRRLARAIGQRMTSFFKRRDRQGRLVEELRSRLQRATAGEPDAYRGD